MVSIDLRESVVLRNRLLGVNISGVREGEFGAMNEVCDAISGGRPCSFHNVFFNSIHMTS